ncbi:MAG TPA: endonuclease/exonuclease/phosphatase family protein [Gemmatimonadaceae bacterium]
MRIDVVRVVTYNIRHGRGQDDTVSLARTAAVLRRLAPDLVGLQEVDDRVRRSGGVAEAESLGTALGAQAAFDAFMDYQGGRYGLAILSRHPVAATRSIPLPTGNEPRVALLVETVLPRGDTIAVITVHFDWVDADSFRFAQASALAAVLDTLRRPWVLLGDFNDLPESRTLALFRARALEARKPEDARLTFPSDEPDREIDYVFVAPAARWRVRAVSVIDERVASDHRPVLAVLELLGR